MYAIRSYYALCASPLPRDSSVGEAVKYSICGAPGTGVGVGGGFTVTWNSRLVIVSSPLEAVST